MTTTHAPRKTRAPRTPSTFRTTSVVAATISLPMRQHLDAYCSANRDTNRLTLSKLIRASLSEYARKVKTTKVPDEFRPPADYRNQSNISAVIKDPTERDQYEGFARHYGITMSELILRCLFCYVFPATPSVPSCPAEDKSP